MPSNPPSVALITGAARRIGRAIASDLVAHGWRVAVHYNSSGAEAEEVVAAIAATGGRALKFEADLCREDAVGALIPRVNEAMGPVTCLINNASVFNNDSVETATRESWDLHLQVNLRAPFVLTQKFVSQLPGGVNGNVINLIDQRVWNLTPHFTSYTVSKMGLWTLTRTLAMALSPRVRVNAIGPGPTLPNDRQTEDQFENQWSSVPLQRRVQPQEICDAVRFILDAPSMTGQMIAVDGGQHLGWNRTGARHAPDD